MDEAARSRRILRYLKALERGQAELQETADPGVLLMRFPGDRSIKLPRTLYRLMTDDALIAAGRSGATVTLSLTGTGRAAVKRLGAGGCAAQHQERALSGCGHPARPGHVQVNLDESPLASLARLKRPDGETWLARKEIAAGERLRTDFETAMLQPRVTASWDPARVARSKGRCGNTVAEFSAASCAARSRVNAAVAAVGPELAGVLLDLCCFLKGLEQVERERGWPRRSAKLMLKTALGALDRHYHPPPHVPDIGRFIRHWGADGYRPEMS